MTERNTTLAHTSTEDQAMAAMVHALLDPQVVEDKQVLTKLRQVWDERGTASRFQMCDYVHLVWAGEGHMVCGSLIRFEFDENGDVYPSVCINDEAFVGRFNMEDLEDLDYIWLSENHIVELDGYDKSNIKTQYEEYYAAQLAEDALNMMDDLREQLEAKVSRMLNHGYSVDHIKDVMEDLASTIEIEINSL